MTESLCVDRSDAHRYEPVAEFDARHGIAYLQMCLNCPNWK